MECTQIWKQPAEKLLELTGLDPSEIILTVQVEVVARDRIRLLNDITDILSELFIDILHIHSMSNGQKGLASVEVEIDLPYTIMLVDILHRIKLIQNVEMVRRVNYPLGEKPKWKIASISDTIPKTENIMSPISILPVIDETVPNEKLRYGVVNHQLLRKKIIDNFKPNELEVLCDDIEANMIGDGETTHLSLNMFGLNRPVMNLVNDIIKYLYNRNLLPYLIDAIQLERPGLLDDVITGANDKKKRK